MLAAPAPGLSQQRQRFFQGQREELRFGLEAAVLVFGLAHRCLRQVRTEPPVANRDLRPVRRIDSHRPRQREQLQGVVERDRLGCVMAQQRCRPGALVDLVGPPHRDVGAEAARPHDDVEARVGVGAQHALGGFVEQRECSFDRQLVGRKIVGQRPGGVAASKVRAESAHPGDHRLTLVVDADGNAVDLRRVDVC